VISCRALKILLGNAAPLALALSCAAALSACGSLFQSKTPAPSVYLLSARGNASGQALAADLAVLKPKVRPGLNGDRIAALYPDRRLDYYAGAKWGGSLDEVVQDLAVQEFHSHASLRSVVGDSSPFASGYWLELEVLDFQAEYAAGGGAPRIRVRLLCRIGKSGDRREFAHFEAGADQAAAADRLGAIVAAYEQAANAALEQIIADTTGALTANLEGR
jgi:ABC-type uncharacterized transport system auxiliary subunit